MEALIFVFGFFIFWFACAWFFKKEGFMKEERELLRKYKNRLK